MTILLHFAIGLVFGLGLVIAGMSNPAKVLNFLDIAAIPSGGWDPSLAFVLAGAVAVTFLGYRLVLRRPRPLLAERFHLPTATAIDRRVVLGPAIFGIGWGLAGFCPGPALTALGTGGWPAILFTLAMLAGMAVARRLSRPSAGPESAGRGAAAPATAPAPPA
ncbi:YeeE/YedE family protein [Falsiroseomonas tokyonensis]|uniref:DUF6691 family protein n=1 Tax=Falsiroseomonas tokyonensis TaxID=430521 RepID=A0ABV7C302_9PROT|nr:YeeE/YedE family protein [Falsiroseomonas tokyonensis]MBU8540684.1 YeeE/YedE family protein [Falsiroseomonas tokyonensis]